MTTSLEQPDTRIGLPLSNSAVVSIRLRSDFDEARLDGLSTATRAGALKATFHLYKNSDDVAALTAAVAGSVR